VLPTTVKFFIRESMRRALILSSTSYADLVIPVDPFPSTHFDHVGAFAQTEIFDGPASANTGLWAL
jgi:hypothetical protein